MGRIKQLGQGFKIAWMLTRNDQILSKLEGCTEERGMSRKTYMSPRLLFSCCSLGIKSKVIYIIHLS